MHDPRGRNLVLGHWIFLVVKMTEFFRCLFSFKLTNKERVMISVWLYSEYAWIVWKFSLLTGKLQVNVWLEWVRKSLTIWLKYRTSYPDYLANPYSFSHDQSDNVPDSALRVIIQCSHIECTIFEIQLTFGSANSIILYFFHPFVITKYIINRMVVEL